MSQKYLIVKIPVMDAETAMSIVESIQTDVAIEYEMVDNYTTRTLTPKDINRLATCK